MVAISVSIAAVVAMASFISVFAVFASIFPVDIV